MNAGTGFNIANFVIFQSIWVAAVVFQNDGLWVCIGLIGLHFALSPERKADFSACYKAVLLGILIDAALMLSGVYIFPEGHFPLWLVCLWIGFVLTLRHSMRWLWKKSIYWQIGLGSIGGTTSYLAGSRLGAVQLGIDIIYVAVLLLLIWSILVPLLLRMVNGGPHVQQMA